MTNSIGEVFTITTFGESHGKCISTIVDGCPAGLPLSEKDIQAEVDRRKPTTDEASTSRAEEDKVEIISGVLNGRTTGAPVCMMIWNKDVDSSEYEKVRSVLRPGHADYTAYIKYGGFNDFRGGGKFSGRITASFVMAGVIAKKLLDLIGVEVVAHTVEIGGIKAKPKGLATILKNLDNNPFKCADPEAVDKIRQLVEKVNKEGDSIGGIIEGRVINVPPGLGEPVYDTLEGNLSKAIFAIPAVKGIEFGAGFSSARKMGSENNDPFTLKGGKIVTTTNNAGGILGGISNGMPIVLKVAIKPTPSISKKQETVDVASMKNTELEVRGRHDVCIVPRAVPIVEAMIAITLCDFALRARIIPEVIK